MYWIMERIPATRESALRLGLVENPCQGKDSGRTAYANKNCLRQKRRKDLCLLFKFAHDLKNHLQLTI